MRRGPRDRRIGAPQALRHAASSDMRGEPPAAGSPLTFAPSDRVPTLGSRRPTVRGATMDETTIELTAGGDEQAPLYLSNCDPGDEAEERAAGPAEIPPLAA